MEFECALDSETVEARRGAASSHGHAQVNAMSQWVSREILSTLMSTENNMRNTKGDKQLQLYCFPIVSDRIASLPPVSRIVDNVVKCRGGELAFWPI